MPKMFSMKKIKTCYGIIILLIISLISILPNGQSEENSNIDSKNEYTSIQEAIDSTFEGDSIYIYGGEYHEDIYINKSLTLEGKILNNYVPVIIGNVTIAASNVTVSDLYIKNGSGIRIIGMMNSSSSVIYSNITIKNNVIFNNFNSGIFLRWVNYTNISGNTIMNNPKGIHLQYAYYNIIKENNIENNSEYGLYLLENTQNTIFHNNFINNTIHVLDGGNNYWDNFELKQGNYWDDYNGSDKNNDGIGDVPYVIYEENIDKYPLMMPYDGTIGLKEFYVDEGQLYTMLIIGLAVAILFCLPIGYIWYRKHHKK